MLFVTYGDKAYGGQYVGQVSEGVYGIATDRVIDSFSAREAYVISPDIDLGTYTLGEYGHAEGEYSGTAGKAAHAEGIKTVAYGKASHAEGEESYAVGKDSHAEGYHTESFGDFSHAEGKASYAKGEDSHAEGYASQALGTYSHAEGGVTKASGTASHSEGESTVASGHYTHAEGYKSKAIGELSHAEGRETEANGYASHTEGHGTHTKSYASHAQGKFNVIDNSEVYADIVGNGTESARSNAYALTWGGQGRYAGDVYVNCNSDSTGGKKLATEEYVDEHGGGGAEKFVVTFSQEDDTIIADKTPSEVTAAHAAGKIIEGIWDSMIFSLDDTEDLFFGRDCENSRYEIYADNEEGWVISEFKFIKDDLDSGDIIYGSNTSMGPAILSIGSSGQVLTVENGLPAWKTPSGGDNDMIVNFTITMTSPTEATVTADKTPQEIITAYAAKKEVRGYATIANAQVELDLISNSGDSVLEFCCLLDGYNSVLIYASYRANVWTWAIEVSDLSETGLPSYTSTEAGKVLKVNSNATGVEWGNAGGESDLFLVKTEYAGSSQYRADKTASEIYEAVQSGKKVVMQEQYSDTDSEYAYFELVKADKDNTDNYYIRFSNLKNVKTNDISKIRYEFRYIEKQAGSTVLYEKEYVSAPNYPSLTGEAGKVLKVREDEEGFEWAEVGGGESNLKIIEATVTASGSSSYVVTCTTSAAQVLSWFNSGYDIVTKFTGAIKAIVPLITIDTYDDDEINASFETIVFANDPEKGQNLYFGIHQEDGNISYQFEVNRVYMLPRFKDVSDTKNCILKVNDWADEVEWVKTTPDLPTTDGEYMLKIRDGVATWVTEKEN